MPRPPREQWLNAALELLVEHGPGALTIERLGARVGLTKGSFYHHFRHLADFRTALLAHVEEVGYTTVVRVADEALGPRARLARLADEVASGSPAFETALRAWAASDPEVAALTARLDRERLDYLDALLSERTGDTARGRLLARLTYATYLGALQLQPPVSGPELRQMLAEIEHLATLEDTA